ncbi:MAG TPA: hypothetical protein VHL52_14140 [Acidimicrobiia bacterium]|nr:hypothetical protein [Acidimicrobiia bacterium]
MLELHQNLAWAAVALDALVGMWGVVLAWQDKTPARPFWIGVGTATVATLVQVAGGVYLIAAEGLTAGDQHVFYGIVIAFVFAFAYIYRAQLSRKPALYYGALLLFVMGLGLRTIATRGVDF